MQRHYQLTIGLLLLLLITVACGTATTDEPAAAAETVGEAAVVAQDDVPAPTDDPPATAEPAPTDTQAPEPTEVTRSRPEVEILTEDDRPGGLRSLTRTWNTDWTRHTIDYADILSGGPPRDGIPSIDNPQFADIATVDAEGWLADVEPVVALEINGDARAYPIQVLTWHEIVNDTVGDVPVVVTFCPLCNSALAFERVLDGQPVEFGVSGLLRNSDLIMYDRTTESLWQQFTGEGIVGEKAGERLTFLGSSLVSYASFKETYPDGIVLTRETGHRRAYGDNPYVGYDTIGSNPFLFTGDLDGRLPAVARVATLPLDDDNLYVAYPYAVLETLRVVQERRAGQDIVVFFEPGTTSALGARTIAEAEDVGATAIFDPNLNGQTLTFAFDGSNIVDQETGSTWNILGQATAGELAGERLTRMPGAGDHFWFSWAAFRPDTILFEG